MELIKEMIECLIIRLQKPGKCADCLKSETVSRRKKDNHCLISVACDEWLEEQVKSLGE